MSKQQCSKKKVLEAFKFAICVNDCGTLSKHVDKCIKGGACKIYDNFMLKLNN